MVDVQGRGVVPACSTPAADGMVVKTSTKQIQEMRKIIVELMLASHDQSCNTCPKSGDCRLQKIAHQMGIKTVRFKKREEFPERDLSSVAIQRDPAKCILCGDCVRVCKEIQTCGVLEFAGRGAKAIVTPYYKKGIGEVDCVNCGQCVKICPVGALTPNNQVDEVWNAIHNSKKTVVVQIAPAVRVAIGENFGYEPGNVTTGQMVTALRMMGFDRVYDTSFAADFTVIEEGNEFLERLSKGEKLPQFTSCCPAWVKFAEQNYPELLPNLSTCRSPQQMFGALCKDKLTKDLGIPREDLIVISIMPCTAKKFEASRPEFTVDGSRDVDVVLTTQELSLMIKERGIDFGKLDVGAFDMPFGFKSGAAVIFGTSGGVSEAVLRYASDMVNKEKFTDYKELRVDAGLKTAEVTVGGKTLRLAIVSGLGNTRKLIEKLQRGEAHYDLVEVMACCGGCVNGGGQPLDDEHKTVTQRAKGLYDNDIMLQVHSSEENPYMQKMYTDDLDAHKAHKLLHTHYIKRK